MQPLLTYNIMLPELAAISAALPLTESERIGSLQENMAPQESLLPNGVKPEMTCYNSICLGSGRSARFISECF